jgi:predicted RNase H-like HicB family nuclease
MAQEILYIDVELNDEDEEYGLMYIATNDAIGLVTDGKTFEELLENLKDAIAVCLEDPETIIEANLIPKPQVILRMRLPEPYAKAT